MNNIFYPREYEGHSVVIETRRSSGRFAFKVAHALKSEVSQIRSSNRRSPALL